MSYFTSSLLVLSTILLPSITFAAPSANTKYALSPSSHQNLCLAPSTSQEGTALVVKTCDTSTDIVWTYVDGSLKNTETNMCIDVTDGASWSGNRLQLWGCYNNNRNQNFDLHGDSIKWGGKNMCLDLIDGKDQPGNGIQIWSCHDGNVNQQWVFSEVEEVEGDDQCDVVSSVAPTPSASAIPSATDSAAAANGTAIGGELWAGNGHKHSKSSDSWASATASDSWASATGSDSWASATKSNSWGSATGSSAWASATGSAAWGASSSGSKTKSSFTPTSTGTVTTGSGDMSGYLQAKGSKTVDGSGNEITLKGVNLGGWLVWEDWMCGMSDSSGGADRFAQTTLENRFGVDRTWELVQTWQDNWLVSSDFDKIASMDFNMVRLPFSYRTLQWANGSWITDSNGNVDMSRLDWAVSEAKKRGIYTIPTFHIWETQDESYSLISENSDAGQAARDKGKLIWEKVASHFKGENSIAAFDAINEPTGSWGDKLQRDMYDAIRSVDPKRLIVMESISTDPSTYGWTNVIYSMHEYLMMGSDEGYSQNMWNQGGSNDVKKWQGYNIPVYLGEFMADGNTLTWLLDQVNGMNGVWWSSWTFKTVNMGRWGLWNFAGWNIDVGSASFEDIKWRFGNMGGINEQEVSSIFKSKTGKGWKKREEASPRVGSGVTKRMDRHSRRSRLQHGKKSAF